ncbi:MAG: 30S ribosomal protein S18 [Candidatus Omnitrophota bacterium]
MQKKRGTFDKKRKGKKTLFRRKKPCRFCTEKQDFIDYKATDQLQRFITERGKILPSRISGTCANHQRTLAKAIRRARAIALIPYIANYS